MTTMTRDGKKKKFNRITTILLAMIITIGGMVFAAPQSVYADTILATNGWQQKEGYSIAPDDGTGIEWGYVGNNKWEYNTESKVFTVTPVDPTTIPTDHYKGTSDVGGEPGTLPKGNISGYFQDTSSPDGFFRLPWLNQAYLKDVKTIIFNQDENGNKVSVPSGSANGMFKNMENLETADVANLDVSEVTNMMNMFRECFKLSSIPGINTWNISKCTNIQQMFYKASSLKELDLSNWKVGDGATLAVGSLFRNSGIKVLDISGLDPSKLSAVMPMFYSTDKGLDVLKLGSGWDLLTDEELKKYLGDEYSKTDWINDGVTKAGIKGAGVYVRSLESPLCLYAKKVDANGNGLEGAEFYVRNASGQYLEKLPQYSGEYTKTLTDPAKFTDDRSKALVFTSDGDGKLLIDGTNEEITIDRAGTYILEEKTAPAGYRKDTDQYIVKISRGEEPEYIKGTATPGTTTEELDKNGEPVIHINDEVLIGDSSKYDRNQMNYYENKEDGYELKKQAEWEDIEDGRAKISFTVKRPQLDEGGKNDYSPHAVYVLTPCDAHGFSENIARRNIEQLLRYYDTVDVIVLNGDSVDGIKYYDDVGSANGPTVSDVIEDTLFTTNQHRGINIPYALNKYFETHKWLNDTSGNKTGTETTVVYVSTDRKLLTSCNGLSYGSEGDPYATKEDMEKDVEDAFEILKKYKGVGAYFGIFGDYNDGENNGRYTFRDEGKQLLAWSIIDGLIDPKQYESMAGKSIEDAMAYAQNTTVMSYQNDFQSLGIAADPNNIGQEMVRTSKLTDTISTDLEVDSIEVYYYDDAGSKVTLTIPYTVDGQEFEFDLSDLDPAIEYHIDVHASVKELGNADDWFDTNDGNATLKDIRIVTGEAEDKEKSIEVKSPRLHQVGVTYEGEKVETKEGEDGIAYLPIENEPVEPHEFTIKKVDARGNALKGATFTLSGKTDSGENIKDVKNEDDQGNYLIGQTGEFDGRPTLSTTTDNDGKVTFSNLPDGTYTLTESIAPVGYASVPDMTVKVTTEKTTTGEGGQTTTEYTPKVSISLARYDKDAGVWVVTDPDTGGTSITEEQKNAKLTVTKTWKGAAPDSDSAANPVIVIRGFNESNVQWDFQSTGDAPEKWDKSGDTWTYTFDVSDQLSYTYFEEDYTGYATSAPEDPSNTKKAERDADGNFTAAVTNTELVKVNYTSDEYGEIKDDELTSEEREYNSNPTGSESEPNDGYEFSHWTCDKDVTLRNGTVIKAGERLTSDQVKRVVIKEEVTFTAHHTPNATVDLTAEKIWKDNNNFVDLRTDVTLHLTANGKFMDAEYDRTIDVDKDKKDGEVAGSASWKYLPLYDEDGEEIKYDIVEDSIFGYQSTIESEDIEVDGKKIKKFTVTNTYEPPTMTIEATKEWKDLDDFNKKREDITLHLDAIVDGKEIKDYRDAITIKKDAKGDELTVKWEKLPVYSDNGKESIYTVREDDAAPYETRLTMTGSKDITVYVDDNFEDAWREKAYKIVNDILSAKEKKFIENYSSYDNSIPDTNKPLTDPAEIAKVTLKLVQIKESDYELTCTFDKDGMAVDDLEKNEEKINAINEIDDIKIIKAASDWYQKAEAWQNMENITDPKFPALPTLSDKYLNDAKDSIDKSKVPVLFVEPTFNEEAVKEPAAIDESTATEDEKAAYEEAKKAYDEYVAKKDAFDKAHNEWKEALEGAYKEDIDSSITDDSEKLKALKKANEDAVKAWTDAFDKWRIALDDYFIDRQADWKKWENEQYADLEKALKDPLVNMEHNGITDDAIDKWINAVSDVLEKDEYVKKLDANDLTALKGTLSELPTKLDEVKVRLLQNDAKYEPNGDTDVSDQTLNKSNKWQYTWKNVDIYDSNSKPYTYSIEDLTSGDKFSVKMYYDNESGKAAVENILPPTGSNDDSVDYKNITQDGAPKFTKGNSDFVSYKLKDGDKEVDELTVYGEDGKEQGTYTIDTTTGKVTFTPAKDYVGKPKPATVIATDENGYKVEGVYQPNVLNRYQVTYIDDKGVSDTVYQDDPGIGSDKPEPKAPSDPKRKGYVFTGWKDPVYTYDSRGNVESITYEATWRPERYIIKYDANGGKGTMSDQHFTFEDDTMKSKDNEFTRPGYNFKGFIAVDKTGKEIGFFTSIEEFREYLVAQGDGGEVTLIAQWEKIDGDGGTTPGGGTDDKDKTPTVDKKAPTTKSTPSKIAAPKTGDDTDFTMWLCLMIISLTGIALAYAMRRNERRKAHGKE